MKKHERRDNIRANGDIRHPVVRVLTSTNEDLGVMPIAEAIALAEKKGLDLVEVTDKAKPPVCRITDRNKFLYEKRKREKEKQKKDRKNQVVIKEITFRPSINEHDLETKLKHIVKFIAAGNKVKITIRFRGREMVHPEIGMKLMSRIEGDLEDIAQVEMQPKFEGRQVVMVMAPSKKKKQ